MLQQPQVVELRIDVKEVWLWWQILDQIRNNLQYLQRVELFLQVAKDHRNEPIFDQSHRVCEVVAPTHFAYDQLQGLLNVGLLAQMLH